jgi:hypothetical protein
MSPGSHRSFHPEDKIVCHQACLAEKAPGLFSLIEKNKGLEKQLKEISSIS